MDEYKKDIFYLNTREFSSELQEKICRDAHSKSYEWWVDNQPEWQRQKIDMSLDEILKYLYTENIHFTVVYRKGYESWNKPGSWQQWNLEIGFCTMSRKHKDGDLFLWIRLDEKYIDEFVEKYNLK